MRSVIIAAALMLLIGALGKADAQDGKVRVLPINWKHPDLERMVSGSGQGEIKTFLEASGASGLNFDKTRLPVLLPVREPKEPDGRNFIPTRTMMSLIAKQGVFAAENEYDTVIRLDGASVLISGDRLFQLSEKDLPSGVALKSDSEVRYSTGERMMEADFSRYGANYSVVVECRAPLEDARCLKTGFAESIVRRLAPIGGRP